MLYCEINGQQCKQLTALDRAFAYGDGVFTTAKIQNGRIEFLPEHLQRLKYACQQLKIQLTQFDLITERIVELAKSYQKAVLKITITAGQGGRGYSRQGIDKENIVISVFAFPEYYQQWRESGITLGLSEQQLGVNPMLQGIKHLNRLEQVLLKSELDQRNEDELLVVDIFAHLVETTASNFFWFEGSKIYTPELSGSGVNGLIRQQLLLMEPAIEQVKVGVEQLSSANAMFISNCIMGIVPIKQFKERQLDISPVKRLQQKFSALIEGSLED